MDFEQKQELGKSEVDTPDSSNAFAAELNNIRATESKGGPGKERDEQSKDKNEQGIRANPWGDVTSGSSKKQPESGPADGLPKPPIDATPSGDRPTVGRDKDEELIKKVQDAAKTQLEKVLQSSKYEKELVVGMQSAIIGGDPGQFKYYMRELYKDLDYQGLKPYEKSRRVNEHLGAIERCLRQTCGVDISIDFISDDRTMIRVKPDPIALELSNNGNKVKRIEEVGGTVSIDQNKEVIKPTTWEHVRSISDRCISSRKW